MRSRLSSRGYLRITLSKGRGRYHYDLVHRLIAATWLGEPAEGLEVNHKNGDKTDNRIENLEWATRTENERHARRVLGKDCRGESHKGAKLSIGDVLEIRKLKAEGWSYPKLAKRFPVGMSQLCRIVKREKWGHV